MSETLPEGITRGEFDELKTSVTELAGALKAQQEASTPVEKAEAKQEVKEAKADLDDLAKELGISPAKLKQAADDARRQERKEELRPLLVELLDEELEPKPEDEGEEKPGGKPAKKEPEAKKETPEPEPEPGPEPEAKEKEPEDSAPGHEHWSERSVGELIK